LQGVGEVRRVSLVDEPRLRCLLTQAYTEVMTMLPPASRRITELEGRATITVAEAATLIGIGRTAAYEAARRGELPTRRLGRRLVVPVPWLLEWLEGR